MQSHLYIYIQAYDLKIGILAITVGIDIEGEKAKRIGFRVWFIARTLTYYIRW